MRTYTHTAHRTQPDGPGRPRPSGSCDGRLTALIHTSTAPTGKVGGPEQITSVARHMYDAEHIRHQQHVLQLDTTDSTERGRSMWARVKGRTENVLLAMDFQAYMFRPGYIQAMHGAKPKTPAYRWMYVAASWLYPVLRRVIPTHVTTTENLGRAMLAIAGREGAGGTGAGEHILYSPEINRLAAEGR
ncbi:hypothetical protein ABCR94_25245 [Streptomyces sp. 21So2-11]|uniref:hypothetical protein n=1 Tax=Streptomyces sp. 21So2-11 TaxID=3144408 RepID=UPI00321A4144